MIDSNLMLRTIHGSHLYGLATENSDVDWYEVWFGDPWWTTGQVIEDGDDTIRVTLTEFLDKVGKGSHQALEALWSRQAEYVSDSFVALRYMISPTFPETYRSYRSPIKGMVYYQGNDEFRLKRQRQAYRMVMNLNDLYLYGSFNPTLDKDQIDRVRSIQKPMDPDEFIDYLNTFSLIDLRN